MKQLLITFLLLSVLCMPGTAQYRRIRPQVVRPITIVEFTSGIGLSKINVPYSRTMLGFTAAQGIIINDRVIIALGTGLSFYNGGPLMPLFADFRYSFYNNHRYTAYFLGEGGFLFNASKHFEYTKLFLTPGAGIKYDFNRYFSTDVSLGLFVQQGILRDSFINLKMGIVYRFK
jgi:hypothetical protein